MFNALFSRVSRHDQRDLRRYVEAEYGREIHAFTKLGYSRDTAVTNILRGLK